MDALGSGCSGSSASQFCERVCICGIASSHSLDTAECLEEEWKHQVTDSICMFGIPTIDALFHSGDALQIEEGTTFPNVPW